MKKMTIYLSDEPIQDGHEWKWIAWVDHKFIASEDTLDKLYKKLGKKKEKATVFKVPEGLLVI